MRIVIALGGNALLRRGEVLSAAAQQRNIELAAELLAGIAAAGHRLIVTHGNGPQVGLLALQSAAGPARSALPLDVLDAQSEGWVGYAIELALRNALPRGSEIVTLLTQTLVDAADTAFRHPVKPIGPLYDAATAQQMAAAHGWAVAPDGDAWRRVVASPKPLEIIELASIRRLADAGVIVICAGGGGIPVSRATDGRLTGVEAVIDKDATSALLATQTAADMFLMLTDVAGVFLDFGTDHARMLTHTTPLALAAQTSAFTAGSMAPKVRAACDFVSTSGGIAGIGALADAAAIIARKSGTIITAG